MNDNRPIIDYETMDDENKKSLKKILEEKKNKNEKEDSKKKRQETTNSNRIIAGIIIISIFVVIFVAIGVALLKEDSTIIPTNNADGTININSKPNSNSQTFATTSKLTLPEREPSMFTLSETTNKINEINKGIVSYFTEIKETVLSFKEKNTSEYDFEQDLLKYQNNILLDIDVISKYRVMYENYQCFNLYSVQVQRLQNELELINSLASTMTEEALISTFNNYVEKEKRFNDQMIEELKTYFNLNKIQYEEKQGYIIYVE